MEIAELNTFTEREYEELVELMAVLDSTISMTRDKLSQAIMHPTCHLFVMRHEGRIIGCYTLGVFFSPTGKKASIEDVVVHPDFQGLHLGRMLMEDAIARLRGMAPIHVQLTSRPHRVVANALYRAVGFTAKETNVYVIDMK